MTFEKLDETAISHTGQKTNMFVAASGTTIETKVLGFWKTDGYDDKVPVLAAY